MITRFSFALVLVSCIFVQSEFVLARVAIAPSAKDDAPVYPDGYYAPGSGCFYQITINCANVVPTNLPRCVTSKCVPTASQQPGEPIVITWKCGVTKQLDGADDKPVSHLNLVPAGSIGNLAGAIEHEYCGLYWKCSCNHCALADYNFWLANNMTNGSLPDCRTSLEVAGPGYPFDTQSLSPSSCTGTGVVVPPVVVPNGN